MAKGFRKNRDTLSIDISVLDDSGTVTLCDTANSIYVKKADVEALISNLKSIHRRLGYLFGESQVLEDLQGCIMTCYCKFLKQ